jgi:starch synthase
MKKNILYVFQEITPYLPETPMSVIGRYLPQKIQEMGNQIRVFMPRYGLVKERRNQLHEVIRLSGMNIVVNDADHSLLIKVASIQSARMQVYFIDNEDYFQRKAIFRDDNGGFYPDNDERAIFFARGVMETIKKLRWTPDLVHIHGWLGSLIPLYLRKSYKEDPIFHHAKVVVSVYDDNFNEGFDEQMKKKIRYDGFSETDLKVFEKPDYNNLLKLAVKYSDGVIQASEKVSQDVIDFANSSKKPFLAYQQSENYEEQYSQFYDDILDEVPANA